MGVSFEEQETTISIYPKQVSTDAEIYTCIPAAMTRLKKLAAKNPEQVKIEKEDEIGLFATVPSSWVSIRRPRRVNLTEEQKRANTERMLAGRLAKQN